MKSYFQKIVRLFISHDYPLSIQKEFHQWLLSEKHASEKEAALKQLWVEARSQGTHPGVDAVLARWRQSRTASIPLPGKATLKRVSLWFWQSAATVLLLVAISLGYFLSQIERTEPDLVQQFVPTADMQIITLPDGSQVQMNSRSTLLYPRQFDGKNRSVYLIGEANFKVKPDEKHPFIVKSTDFQVTALGTEFNVSAYPEANEITATLLSGSILVSCDNLAQRRILQPGEQLAYHKANHRYTLGTPNMADATAWQRGELIFREMTLKDIITVLERKYDYQFIYSLHSLRNDHYSFRFKDKASLPEVMDVIVDVVGNLKCRIQDDRCYIIQKQKK